MQKRILRLIACAMIIGTILTSMTTANAAVRMTKGERGLEFNGTTAQCYACVTDTGKAITVTAKLWQGTTLVGSWANTGTSFVAVSGQTAVRNGQIYTLKVSYKINGVIYHLPDISKTCPNNTK